MNDRWILLTRPVERARETQRRLEAMGAEVVALPLVQLVELPGDAQAQLVPAPDCIAFTSPSAVEFFTRRCADRDDWKTIPTWAVGAGTARALRDAGFEQIHESGRADGASLAGAMQLELSGHCDVLLPGSKIRRPELPRALEAAGHRLRLWDLYDTQPIAELPPRLLQRLQGGDRAMLLFYSPSALEAWNALSIQHGLASQAVELALFGPTTARRAVELGLPATIALDEANEDEFLAAIARHWSMP